MSNSSNLTGNLTGNRKLISVVTPCYNEELNVLDHFNQVTAAIEPFRKNYDFEHIYTDNCSVDRTFTVLSDLATKNPNVRVLRFSRNIGATRAVLMGLERAAGDAIILIQADLQDPPSMIPEFIKGWEEGNDVVYGKILNRQEGPIIRSCRKLYYKIVSQLSDVPIPENAGDFRLTSRRVLDAVLEYEEDELYIRGAVAHVGYSQKPIPFVRQSRSKGRSSASLPYLVSFAMNGLLSTTVVPIRAVILTGLATAAVGFAMTSFFILGKIFFPALAPQGFTTLASLVTFFAGMQLLAIGIIGEYIRKIYVQTHYRPRGFIRDTINF